jgi:hypothetical protein
MRSACAIDDNLWAIKITVISELSNRSSSAALTARSDSESRALVASSMRRTEGLPTKARAMAMRWR